MDKTKHNKSEFDEKNPVPTHSNDPIKLILALFEKKKRNLEKRKLKGLQLKGLLESGKDLNADQQVSVAQMHGVTLCLDMLQDLFKSISAIQETCSVSEPCKPVSGSPRSSPSEKDDIIKRVVEMQSRFHKLVENKDKVKELQSTDDKILTNEEVDTLIAFWTPLSSHKSYGSSYKSKKPISTYRQFIEKDSKIVGPHCPHTFAAVYELYEKINPSVFATRPKPKSKQSVVPVVSSVSTSELPKEKVVQISVSSPDTKSFDKKSKSVETNGWVDPPARKSNAAKNNKSKPNGFSNKKNSVQPLQEKPQSISVKPMEQTKIVVTDIFVKTKKNNPRTQGVENKKTATWNKHRPPTGVTATTTA